MQSLSRIKKERSRVITTKWNLIFHYVSIAFAMVSGIFMVPLYLKFLGVDIYGVWLATGNILVWLTAIDPGISTVLQQRIAEAYGKKDFQGLTDYLTAGLVITAVIVIFMILLGFLFARFLPSLLNLPFTIDAALIQKAFIMALIGSTLIVFSCSIIAVNQGLQGSLGVGIIDAVVTTLSISLTVFLLYGGFGLLGITVSQIFQGIGLILGNSGYLFWRIQSEKLGYSFSFRKVSNVARLIAYTFWGRIGGVVANNMDLIVVSRFLGPETVAMLNLTRKAPDMSRMFIERPAVAFMPAVSHLFGAGEIMKAKPVLLRLLQMIIWSLGLVVGCYLALNDDFVRLWVGPALFAGQTINLIICITVLTQVIVCSLASLCFALGNIKGNSLISLVQSLLQIPLVIFGVKYFGILGAVLAPLIPLLVVQAWYFPLTFSKLLDLVQQDRNDIVREILCVMLASIPLTLAFTLVYPTGWLYFIAIVAAFCFIYISALYLASGPFRTEINHAIHKMPLIFRNSSSNKSL